MEPRPGGRPDELVPGDPGELERLAARLSRFAAAAGDASAGLTGLDSEHWSGRAAEGFRAAVGPMPRQLARAGGAFAAAARALSGYATALRAAQSAAAAAIRLVERSTPESAAADRATAWRMVERARAEVAEAARAAAARLAEVTTDAPAAGSGVQRSGPLPAVCGADGTVVRAVSEHRLADPDGYVAPVDDLADSVHFGQDHQVEFAGADAAAGRQPDWSGWAGQSTDRGLGQVEPDVLAGLGIAAVGLTMIGRRRRDRTAFALASLDDAEIRRRRDRRGAARNRDGVAAPARSGSPHSADAWRTRLASTPRPGGTVHAWAGPEANPLPRVTSAEAVRLTPADRQVSGVVLHTGPPADERRPGAGAPRPEG